MQRAGPPPGSFPLLAERLPIPFQCFPHGFPILRRRLHDYFFGLLLDEPRSQRSQLFRVAANIRRSNWYSLSISTSDTTTASIFLWTSIPAIRYDIDSSWPGAESVLRLL